MTQLQARMEVLRKELILIVESGVPDEYSMSKQMSFSKQMGLIRAKIKYLKSLAKETKDV